MEFLTCAAFPLILYHGKAHASVVLCPRAAGLGEEAARSVKVPHQRKARVSAAPGSLDARIACVLLCSSPCFMAKLTLYALSTSNIVTRGEGPKWMKHAARIENLDTWSLVRSLSSFLIEPVPEASRMTYFVLELFQIDEIESCTTTNDPRLWAVAQWRPCKYYTALGVYLNLLA